VTLHPDIAAVLSGESEGCVVTGDCLEIMADMPDGCVDAVVTDPPYDAKTHNGARYGFRATSSKIPFAPLLDVSTVVASLLRVSLGWVVAFCSLEMYGDYKRAAENRWVRAGFWRRPNGVPQFTGDRPGQPGEGIAIMHAGGIKRWNGGGRHGFWVANIEQHGRVHPTEKPLGLMQSLVADFTNPGDTIFDPHCGSGTTCVAAKKLGRRWIGIEIDPAYAEIARNRVKSTPRPLFTEAAEAKPEQADLFAGAAP